MQLKTGFNEDKYSSDLKKKSNLDWNKGKVFGCPIRVKTMSDVEQILSELAITNNRIVISKFDMSFLSTPVHMPLKKELFRSAKHPADLIFQQCIALNKLDQIGSILPDLDLVKLLSYKETLETLL